MKLAGRLPKNRKFYLLLGGNVLALALIGFFGVRPALGLLVTRTNEINATKAEIASLQEKSQKLSKLEDAFPAYEATYTPILNNLPRGKDTAGYQAELEALANTSNVQLGSVSMVSAADPSKKPTSTGGFPALPVTLDVTGTFATVYDFINRLETMSRFTKVTDLSLSADRSGTVKAAIGIQTVYLP